MVTSQAAKFRCARGRRAIARNARRNVSLVRSSAALRDEVLE